MGYGFKKKKEKKIYDNIAQFFVIFDRYLSHEKYLFTKIMIPLKKFAFTFEQSNIRQKNYFKLPVGVHSQNFLLNNL